MALAEDTKPTAANDAEPKAPHPAQEEHHSNCPCPACVPPADLAAHGLYLKSGGSHSLAWRDLKEETRNAWRQRVVQDDLVERAKALRAKELGSSAVPWDTLVDASRKHWLMRVAALEATAPQSDPPAASKSTYVAEPTHDIPAEVDPLLVHILSWPRGHGTWSELAFCKWLREHIQSLGATPLIMAEGCIMTTVRPPARQDGQTTVHPKPSTTLFSCHVDTIEGNEALVAQGEGEPAPLRKKLTYDPNFGAIALDKDSIGGSLGADDGAGVYLLLKMIEAKVPGSYLFHRGEERGGIGSSAMRDKYPEVLKAFETAIAFDRHDTYEVIYHQGGMRCASLKFTEAMCAALNKHGFKYQPSTRGTFTDTKNYRKLIPECINIAVGYESQHGRNETLDYGHLNALAKALCEINWDALPIDRDPAEADPAPYYGGSYTGGGYGRSTTRQRGFDDEDFAFPQGGTKAKKKSKKKQPPALESGPALSVSEELSACSLEDIEQWCEDYSLDAAKGIGQLLLEIAQLKASNAMLLNLMGWKDDK
jgi:hypothetical protein